MDLLCTLTKMRFMIFMFFYGDPLKEIQRQRIKKPNEQMSKSGLIAMVCIFIYSWDIPVKERQTGL